MTNAIYKLFNKGIKWNAFEGFVYQSVLTLHKIVLFSIIDCLLYGLQSVLFSVLYLGILIFNLGFDKSLATFFSLFTSNKRNFKKIFLIQLLAQIVLLLLLFLLIVFNYKLVANLFSAKFKCPYVSFEIWILLAALFVSESIKKTLRTIGELAFLNKYIALTEVCLITIYVSLFWIAYFKGYQPSLALMFIPHLIQSLIGVLILSYFLYSKIYKPISDISSEHIENQKLIKQIVFVRFSNFVNQLGHLLFSGNFIIPFISSNFGLVPTAVFKFVNDIIIYFTVILERTFGFTSGALLSHLKNSSTNIKQNALNLATNKLFVSLFCILIFLTINSSTAFYAFIKNANVSGVALYIFLIAIIFENFFITMEQFFIVEGKVYYFTIVNLILAFFFYHSIYVIKFFSLTFMLLLLLLFRILAYFILKLILTNKLKIKLSYKFQLKPITIFFLISSIFFVLMNLYLHFR